MKRGTWLIAPGIFLLLMALTLHRPNYLMGDFRAFYCAGAAIAAGADPYRMQPLLACEAATAAAAGTPAVKYGVAVPAPLPPHALLPFALLSRLPFVIAALVYAALSVVAGIAGGVLLARATGAQLLEVDLVLAAVTGTVTLYIGQPMPFVLLALGGAAVSARTGRWWTAAACLTAATCEPHIALPAILALLVFVPPARVPLLGCLGAAAAAGIAALGLPLTVAYARDVLPAHALANAYEWQYSLTSVLTSAGIDASRAVMLGELMFASMLLLGIAVAVRLRRLTGDTAVLVLVPPAFALFGGVHVHVQQLVAAFPAGLYACVRFPRVRALAAAGIAFAMIPWNVVATSVAIGCGPLLVGAFGALRIGLRAGLLLAAAAAAIEISLPLLATLGFGPSETHLVTRTYAPTALAETSWSDFSHAALMRPSLLMQWLRIPTLCGLACMLCALLHAARFPHPRTT
jgi:hypothetical protein